MVTRRLTKNKLWIFATTITLGALMLYLESQGVPTSHSGDMVCGGDKTCYGYFNFTVPTKVTNYLGEATNITALCFGNNLRVVLTNPEKVNNLGLYKADKRYRADNPARWKKFNFTGSCLPTGLNEFMINATKDSYSTVKWAIEGTDIDPKWIGISNIKREEYSTQYDNGDGTYIMTMGRPNVWNGEEWIDASEFTKIVSIDYKNGTIIIGTDYWNITYVLNVSVNGIEYELSKYLSNHTMLKFDKGEYWEYGINITNIPTAITNKIDFIKFGLANEKGNMKNIEVSFDDLKDQGFTLEKINRSVKITNIKSRISNGMLYLDPVIKLNNGNFSADTTLTSWSNTSNADVGTMTSMIVMDAGTVQRYAIMKINLTMLPADIFITVANLSLRTADDNLDSEEYYTYQTMQVYDVTKYNISDAEWTEGGSSATAACMVNGSAITGSEIYWAVRPTTSAQMNLTVESSRTSANGGAAAHWNTFPITDMVKKEYDAGRKNVSVFLNVTRTGTPNTADCGYIDSDESATASYKPYLNVTFSYMILYDNVSAGLYSLTLDDDLNLTTRFYSDVTNIDKILFSSNYSGSWTNYTLVDSCGSSTCWANTSVLKGNWSEGEVIQFYWFGNTTTGYSTVTPTYTKKVSAWMTPYNRTSASSGTNNSSNDFDTSTQYTFTGTSTNNHWIIYDLERNVTVYGLRVWADTDLASQPCDMNGFSICLDSACAQVQGTWTYDFLTTTSYNWNSWNPVSRPRTGRYVKVIFGVYPIIGSTCEGSSIAMNLNEVNINATTIKIASKPFLDENITYWFGSSARNAYGGSTAPTGYDVYLSELASTTFANMSYTIVSENSTGSWINHTTECTPNPANDEDTCWANYTISNSDLSNNEVVGYYFWANTTTGDEIKSATKTFTVNEWMTPYEVGTNAAGPMMDDNTGTYNSSSISTSKNITFDMGSNFSLNSTRIWGDADGGNIPCRATKIMVSNTSGFTDGPANLLDATCSFSTSATWQQCNFARTGTGRYLRVEVSSSFIGTCGNGNTLDFYEIDAMNWTGADWSPPYWSDNSTNYTIGASVVKHSLRENDNRNLSTYTFEYCNGTWNGTHCWIPVYYTITLNESTLANAADAYVDQANNNTNYGTSDYLVTYSYGVMTQQNIRSFIMENLSDQLPTGAVPVAANLSLYVYAAPFVSRTLQAYNTSNNWNETGITWINQPSAGTLQQAITGGTTESVWLTWNVTNAMVSQYSQANKNLSILIKDSSEGGAGNDEYDFYSRNYSSAAYRPQLTIRYYLIEPSPYMINDTTTAFTDAMCDTPKSNCWVNVTKNINTTAGAVMAWRVYVNDTQQGIINNWNTSDVFTYTVAAAEDNTAPTYSKNVTNATLNNTPCLFSLEWNDEIALQAAGQYIFSTNNSGSWANASAVNFTATPQNATNVTFLNETNNTVVGWRFYATDNAGNWNASEIFTLTTTAAGGGDTCDCSSIQAGTPINCAENCDIGACNVGGIAVTFINTGTITTSGDVTNILRTTFSNGCKIIIGTNKRWG